MAALEPVQRLASLRDLTGLEVEDAKRRITARPLRQQIDSAFEPRRSLTGVAFQHRHNSEPPKYLPRTGNPGQSLLQCPFRSANVILAELRQSQRKIVLIVVRIPRYGASENFRRSRVVTQMRVNVTKQRQEGIILLTFLGDLPGRFQRLRIRALAEICVDEIEFHIVRIGIGLLRRLKVLNRVIVQTIARQEHADAGLRSKVAGAQLIQLPNCPERVVAPSQLKVSLRQQVEILRLIRVLLDLLGQLRQIELRAILRRERRPIVQIVEEMLVRLGPRRNILRQRLKYL